MTNLVQTLNLKKSLSVLEELQKEFGGEIIPKRKILKINQFCYVEEIKENDLILTTYVYGMKNQVKGKEAICRVLLSNISNKRAFS